MVFEKETILPANNPKSPFYNNLPKQDAKPIDELVKFFKYYRNLIKSLLNYFKEVSLIKEFESNLHYQVLNSYSQSLNSGKLTAISSPGINSSGHLASTTTSNGGTPPERQDKRPLLMKSKSSTQGFSYSATGHSFYDSTNYLILNHHYQMHNNSLKHYRELINRLIPKLETLLKNLSNKIKEIKSSLRNDSFINDSIIKEISKTGSILHKYMNSIELYNTQDNVQVYEDNDNFNQQVNLDDPFLVKLRLNYQLKNQLIKENYLFAAFVNLQTISKDLLAYVLKDLQNILERFEKTSNVNFKANLSFDANVEWETFVIKTPDLLNIYKSSGNSVKREARQFNSLVIPYSNSIHNKCIRFGSIYKKLKLLKNYNLYHYLLTCNYLHEFKMDATSNPSNSAKNYKHVSFINHDDIPEKSYNLNNYEIEVKNDKSFKFNLIETATGKHTSFKCNNSRDFNNWVTDLSGLLQFEDNFDKRFEFVQQKLSARQNEKTASKSSFHSQIPTVSQTTLPATDSVVLLNSDQSSLAVSNTSLVLPESSLQGVFTPQIRTPSSSGSDRNPFEQSFFIGNNDGNLSGINVNGSGSGSRNSNQSSLPTSPGPGGIDHENYLKIQQEYLRHQQEIITKKLKETQIAKEANKDINKLKDKIEPKGNAQFANIVSDTLQPINSNIAVHRANPSLSSINSNSLESIKSLNPSSINTFLQANEALMVPKFFITDEKEQDKPES